MKNGPGFKMYFMLKNGNFPLPCSFTKGYLDLSSGIFRYPSPLSFSFSRLLASILSSFSEHDHHPSLKKTRYTDTPADFQEKNAAKPLVGYTPPKTNMSPKKGAISIGNTSSNQWFSGDMLIFQGVPFFEVLGGLFVAMLQLPLQETATLLLHCLRCWETAIDWPWPQPMFFGK